MTNTLLLPEVQAVLNRLHALAEAHDDAIIQQVRGPGSTWEPRMSNVSDWSSPRLYRVPIIRNARCPICRAIVLATVMSVGIAGLLVP